jgi:hypothetical protein
MNPWIRLYRASLHNPKIVTLNDRLHRVWHNCLLMADDTGVLPSMRDMACHLRFTVQEAEQAICDLIEVGLVDVADAGKAARKLTMHDWSAHQYVSDTSTERVKKFRNKNKNETNETAMKRFSNGDVAPPESESDTESDTESKLLPSEQDSSKADELRFNLDVLKGKGTGSKDGIDKLKARAEGLGLDVDELSELVARNKPRNPPAYFTTLCVNRLQAVAPGLNEEIIRAALWGKPEAFAAVSNVMLEAAR